MSFLMASLMLIQPHPHLNDVDPLPRTPNPSPVMVEEAPAPVYSVWDAVAECEGSGDWSMVTTGNGYYFVLQFAPTTWTGYGGDPAYFNGPAPPRSELIAVAERVLAGQGPGAWPNCFPN